MKTSIVTALFDIGREKYGRSMDTYLDWFEQTLSLNANMVIFTEERFVDFIWKHRNESNTEVIIQNLTDIPYYRYYDRIEEIIKNPTYQLKIKDNSRIECNLALYSIIQYSKFEWIEHAINNNTFNSEYFFWMDAGCSRFFDYYNGSAWPNINKLPKNKFLIQGNINTNRYLKSFNEQDYIYENNCILVGTLFGGQKDIMLTISTGINDIFANDMLSQDIVNNEQIALALLYVKNPDLFEVYIELNGQHLPLFSHLKNN